MTSFQKFKKFIEENKPVVNEVPAMWPYDYDDRKAYEVELNGLTQYFYFNGDGELIQRKVLTDNRNNSKIN